ncbi:uncharacterized protein LOC125031898 [Penaeus chinensis]|uniref:uncharacterized protein LOC125031898 n=1 Tax=Penaeus chinensis TaxID=139456 RepID=UPI001FB6E82D|nr:uncharacterized protein LOC125031898 [Penaeus chinensis]
MSGFCLSGELNANMQHSTLERSETSSLEEYVTSILPDSFRPNFGEDLDLHGPLDFGQEPPRLWPDESGGDFNLRSRDVANYNPDDWLWSAANDDLNLGPQAEANHNLHGDSWSPANSYFNLKSGGDCGGPSPWAESARAEQTCSRKPEKNIHSVGENMSTATNCERYNQRLFGLWDEEPCLDQRLQLTDGPLLLDSGDSCSSTCTAELADAFSPPPVGGKKGYRHRHARKYLNDNSLQKERNRELNNEASALYRKRKKEAASTTDDHLQHLQQENDNLCNKLQLLTVQSDWCHDVYVKYNDYFAPPLDSNLLP